ncbi:hypothetical protein Y032_0078g1211 [Ancylostoma ceylanicum]|uniref:G-protein coupled receptors family 1 profile domain-containing protein n=2 Tax=Ancylostoma ceylanicum TaxID=53326 RepID=A0A016TT00_9BILA|nr:hypothetical protein Y032_0078g1211 [Ancylostoma ceylanicum]
MSKTEPPSEGTTSSPLSPPNNGSLQLVPLGMIYSTLSLSLIGVVGNALIIAATVSSPSLQKRCNILIATLACADLVVCIYLVQLRVLMLNGWYMIPNRHCYMVSIGGLFSLNVQAGMGLVLGIDRLLAVMSPTRYNRPRSKLLCCCMVFIVFIYSSLLTLYGYFYVSAQTPLGSMMLKRFWIHVECYRFSNTGVPSSGSIQIDVTVGVGCL